MDAKVRACSLRLDLFSGTEESPKDLGCNPRRAHLARMVVRVHLLDFSHFSVWYLETDKIGNCSHNAFASAATKTPPWPCLPTRRSTSETNPPLLCRASFTMARPRITLRDALRSGMSAILPIQSTEVAMTPPSRARSRSRREQRSLQPRLRRRGRPSWASHLSVPVP